jgi:hypothetical protein
MNVHGMSDVYIIPVDLNMHLLPNMTATLDLLKTYCAWMFDDVAAWTTFVHTYVNEITIENMHLTQTLIFNSSATKLYEKVTDEFSLYDLEHRGGPTAFYIMTKHIVATTTKASHYYQGLPRHRTAPPTRQAHWVPQRGCWTVFGGCYQHCQQVELLWQTS